MEIKYTKLPCVACVRNSCKITEHLIGFLASAYRGDEDINLIPFLKDTQEWCQFTEYEKMFVKRLDK